MDPIHPALFGKGNRFATASTMLDEPTSRKPARHFGMAQGPRVYYSGCLCCFDCYLPCPARPCPLVKSQDAGASALNLNTQHTLPCSSTPPSLLRHQQICVLKRLILFCLPAHMGWDAPPHLVALLHTHTKRPRCLFTRTALHPASSKHAPTRAGGRVASTATGRRWRSSLAVSGCARAPFSLSRMMCVCPSPGVCALCQVCVSFARCACPLPGVCALCQVCVPFARCVCPLPGVRAHRQVCVPFARCVCPSPGVRALCQVCVPMARCVCPSPGTADDSCTGRVAKLLAACA